MTSILESAQRVSLDYDCKVLSADNKKGTDFEASFSVDGEKYYVKMHSSKKLNHEQCLERIIKNLDVMAILSARYIVDDKHSISFNPKQNKLKREFENLGKAKNEQEIDLKTLGPTFNDNLRTKRWKRDSNLIPDSSAERSQIDYNPRFPETFPRLKHVETKEKGKEKETEYRPRPPEPTQKPAPTSEEKADSKKERQDKVKNKIEHIRKALELYEIWKTGGGSFPKMPDLGEIHIQSSDEPFKTETQVDYKELWWQAELRDLIKKLDILKSEMEPGNYAKLSNEIEKLREESHKISELPGWGLGKDFAEALGKDPVKLESWSRFLSSNKTKDSDLYKEHMESLLNQAPPEEWIAKKEEIETKFEEYYQSVKEDVAKKLADSKFYEDEERFFWGKNRAANFSKRKRKRKDWIRRIIYESH